MRWLRAAGFVRTQAACWLVAVLATTAQALPGDLDPSFGRGGRLLLPVSRRGDAANAIAVQPDGKIVIAGYALRQSDEGRLEGDAVIVRLLRDGTPDPSFGAAGEVRIHPRRRSADAVGVALQPDGRIVIAGTVEAGRSRSRFWVGRITADGSLDGSFGENGVVTTGFEGAAARAAALILTRDGKIVVAGGAYSSDPSAAASIAVARYLADGRLDPTFARRGRLRLAGVAMATALAEQADGAVVVALSDGFAAARFLADGRLDPTFGGSGIVAADFGGEQQASAVAIRADGRILLGGYAHRGYPELFTDFALVRYRADGTLDPTFGDEGKVLTPISRDIDWGIAMHLHPGGRILLAGRTFKGFPIRRTRFALARYAPDGALDPSFGRRGIVLTGFGERAAGVNAIAVQGTDRIVAAGLADFENGTPDFALARFEW